MDSINTMPVIGRVRAHIHVPAPTSPLVTGELRPQTGAFGVARAADDSSTSGTSVPGGPPV